MRAFRQQPGPRAASPATSLSPLRNDPLAAHLAGSLDGTVLVIGSASRDLLHAVAGSANRIVLIGTDLVTMQLLRRILAEARFEEADVVVAHPAALPFRSGRVDGGAVIVPEGPLDAETRREIERTLGIARAFAIMPSEAAADGDRTLATSAGQALIHVSGRFLDPPAWRTGSALTRSSAVSIVIPTRNRAPLLSRAIESALAQDSPALEVIVVDDGSTDQTGAVIERYGQGLRALRRQPGGQAAAMNAGLEVAKGEWIAWLDDDDYFLPAKLRLQMRTLNDPQVGLAFTAHYLGNAEGRPIEARPLPRFEPGEVLRLLLRGSIFLGPTAMVRREAYAELGDLPYDETLPRAADYAMWWRLARRWKIAVLQVPLTVVRRHSGNALDHARARAIYNSVRRTLRWAWENVPLDELAAGASVGEVQLERGAALLRAGLWAEARSDLEAAYDVNPERAGNLLGLAAFESGDLARAEEQFGAVLARTPRSLEALNGLAAVLLLARRQTEAVGVLDRAVAAHPHDPLSRYNTALAGELTGDATSGDAAPALGSSLTLARDLLAERVMRGALFSLAPPLRGIDAFFADLRREEWGRKGLWVPITVDQPDTPD